MTDGKVVEIRELRFKPANSNDRARAGLRHDFTDVPNCSFAKDDGISPYMGSDSRIDGFPDSPGTHIALHDDVPTVRHEQPETTSSLTQRLIRGGFGLSVLLHAVAALAIGYATISLPDDSALNEGETVIAVVFEGDSEVEARQQGAEETAEAPEEEPVKQKVEEPVEKPEPVKPIEQAKLPEPVKEPVKIEESVQGADVPEVLTTTRQTESKVEAAAKPLMEDIKPEPLPEKLPEAVVVPTPIIEEKPAPAAKLAQPLPHPISKPRVVQKIAEVKPVVRKEEPKPVEKKLEPKKDEPKAKKEIAEKRPEKKTPVVKTKKARGNQGADELNAKKGSVDAKEKGKVSRDASNGNSKNQLKGNAASTNYKGLVQRKLVRAKGRVKVGAKGSVTVAFTITASGAVTKLRVTKSSGKPAIDSGALDVVRKASPFPAIPPEAKRKSWPMTVPMTFKGN